MSQHHPQLLWRDLVASIGFFTRIPMPASLPLPQNFAAALWAAPLAGVVVGLISGSAFVVALWIGLPATVSAVVALAASMLATGALHEDGAADVADGFGGGSTRERKLEIMRDSRIGTYGVCAVALSLLARWSAIEALAVLDGWMIVTVFVAAHAAARALMPAFMALVANARADGLSAGAGRVQAGAAFAALAIGGAALLPVGLSFAVASALALAAWFLILKLLCERQIGGQTGDVLGALEQGGEVIILSIACIFLI